MNKNDLILIGGGGHCKSCIDVIESEGKWNIAGIIETPQKANGEVLGYKIIASDNELEELVKKYRYFLITIGSIKDPTVRIEKFEYLKRLGAEFPVIVSPQAHLGKGAKLDEGTIVMHKALVNVEAQIGKNCIVNTNALVEHESKVGDHCHISTGAIVNGQCEIGNRSFLGSNSVIANNVEIGDDIIVGAGSVVVEPISEQGLYVGNPARAVDEAKGIKI